MARFLSKGTRALARRADEVRNYKVFKKIALAAMSCIGVLLILIYIISALYMKSGSFTVSVNKYQSVQYGLSLSETADFARPTSRLECSASENITNIDGKILDNLGLGAVDGEDNGDNYLCYTFYCKNASKKTDVISFEYSMPIGEMTMGAEEGIRIRVITSINGQEKKTVDYAKAAGVDEYGNAIPEPGTTPFYDKHTVMRQTVENFAKGDVMKVTVVIWFEGNDPQTVDDIIGGEFKVDMKFEVIGITDIDEEEQQD